MSEYILNLLPTTPEERGEFEAIAPQATHVYAKRTTVTQEMLDKATVVMGWPRAEDLSNTPNLRWFQCMWAGTDEYIGHATFPQNCLVSNSAGANAQAVSEHLFASLLSVCRRIPECRDGQKAHQWVPIDNMKTIVGSTILILGAGNIGQCFGKLCHNMGAYTIGLRRTPGDAPEGLDELHTMDKLEELLPKADVVALCLPGVPETNNIMSRHRFSLMKDSSIFLNAGRGNAVDHTALIDALQSGKLWAAALDVVEPEPLPSDNPLWDAPNLLLTPHTGGGIRLEITRKNTVELAQENLRRYMANKPLINPVKL